MAPVTYLQTYRRGRSHVREAERHGDPVSFPERLLVRLPSGDSSVITNTRSTVRSDSANPGHRIALIGADRRRSAPSRICGHQRQSAARTDSLFYDGADRLIRQVLTGGAANRRDTPLRPACVNPYPGAGSFTEGA